MSRCRSCPPVPEELRQAAELLERRWSLAIVYACRTGAGRFGEFMQAVEGIPPRTLAQRLGELEHAGLIERTVTPTRPPHVQYRLTDGGRQLARLVEGFRRWAAQRQAPTRARSTASIRD